MAQTARRRPSNRQRREFKGLTPGHRSQKIDVGPTKFPHVMNCPDRGTKLDDTLVGDPCLHVAAYAVRLSFTLKPPRPPLPH